MVAKQKAGLQSHQQLMVKMKRLADNPSMSKEDMEMFEQMKEALARSEKAKRLGLEPGQFPSSLTILVTGSMRTESSKS